MSKKREIRIFISSPNELFPERELCDKVIDEMNRMLGNRFNVFFSSYRWEKTARAVGMGNPQSRTERVENYDLYFGILWKRFGTPTGNVDSSGNEMLSGTYEEFKTAYEKGVRSYFFRKTNDIDVEKFSDTEKEQFEKVQKFFADFDTNKEHPGIYKNFDSSEKLADYIRAILFDYVCETNTSTALDGHYAKAGLTDLFLNNRENNIVRNERKSEDLNDAEYIKLVAHSGHSYLSIYANRFYDEVTNCLEKGGTVKFLLANPYSEMGYYITVGNNSNNNSLVDALEEFDNERAVEIIGESSWNKNKQSVAIEGYKELKGIFGDRIQLRMCNYEMNATILITDKCAYFEPYLHCLGSERGMNAFETRIRRDEKSEKLYKSFSNYFDMLWSISEDYDEYEKNVEIHKSNLKKWLENNRR